MLGRQSLWQDGEVAQALGGRLGAPTETTVMNRDSETTVWRQPTVWVTVTVVMALAVLGWPGWWWKAASGLPRPGALADALMLVEVAGLLAWRRFPVAGFVVVQVATVAYGALGYPAGPAGYAGLAMTAVVAARCRAGWVRIGALAVALAGIALIDAGRRPSHGLVLLTANGALVVLAWAAGTGLRLVHERSLAVAEAARQGTLHQAEVARRQMAEARLAAAAQLHDGIGHALAGALREAEAAGQVGEGRRAVLLGRLQHRLHDSLSAVGELVVAWEAGRPSPSLAAVETASSSSPPIADYYRPLGDVLGEWITTLANAGLRVELGVAVRAEQISPRVEQILATAVAEGAANVARHSAANAVRIELCFQTTEAVVRVSDPGPARVADPGSGSGLTRLGRLVKEAGGSLQAAPSATGGFTLSARVPTEEPAT